ncbi:MAG: NfeD family protein [Rikenellaceae bacterium]
MTLLIIILLLIVGIALIFAEIVLLPGTTLAAIAAAAAFIAAIVLSYIEYGMSMAVIMLLVSIVLVIITLVFCMRAKSLKKLSLSTTVDSSALHKADTQTTLGREGVAQTRLAPMGTVNIDGKLIEAKCYEGYVDPLTPVKVVGFEDSVVVVSKIII